MPTFLECQQTFVVLIWTPPTTYVTWCKVVCSRINIQYVDLTCSWSWTGSKVEETGKSFKFHINLFSEERTSSQTLCTQDVMWQLGCWFPWLLALSVSLFRTEGRWFWVGLNKRDPYSDGSWAWSDNSPVSTHSSTHTSADTQRYTHLFLHLCTRTWSKPVYTPVHLPANARP